MSSESVYFDHNATTPLDPRAREVMWEFFVERHGNPSSAHTLGRQSKAAVEKARGQVAALLGAEAADLCFTSSGTEANNAVIQAIAEHHGYRGRLLLNTLEHPSIHAAAERARLAGMEVDEVSPQANGLISVESIAEALRPETRLVSLMMANNELGTIQPVAEVAALCRRRGIPVLSDAVQAIGKIAVNVDALGVDYLCLGGHKFYGPPGIAALWTRPGAVLAPLLVGGGQEAGRRASTENVPAIVGLGEAAELARLELESRHAKMKSLRDLFEGRLTEIEGSHVHAVSSPRLPNTSHVAFDGVSGHELMHWLDSRGFAVSTGSACHSGEPQPSCSLLKMGISREESLCSLRISFGITNEEAEVERFLVAIHHAIQAIRKESAII